MMQEKGTKYYHVTKLVIKALANGYVLATTIAGLNLTQVCY